MHQIRKSLVYWAKGDNGRISALAFLIMFKDKAGQHSTIKEFSINKASKVTGCSWSTCKRYMAILIEKKLVHYDEKTDTFSIGRLSSGTRHRNMCIEGLDFRSFFAARDSVRHMIHMLGLVSKYFVKEAIRANNDPKTWPSTGMVDDRKKALRLCKKFVWQDPRDNGGYKYHEYGKSYSSIAEDFGCCTKTAVRVISAGVHAKLFVRHNGKKTHRHWRKLHQGTEKFYSDMFTFVNKGFGCVVDANSYTLTKEWRMKLCSDIRQSVQRPLLEEEYDAYMAKREANQKKFVEKYKDGIVELAEKYSVSTDFLYSLHTSLVNIETMLAFNTPSPALALNRL